MTTVHCRTGSLEVCSCGTQPDSLSSAAQAVRSVWYKLFQAAGFTAAQAVMIFKDQGKTPALALRALGLGF